MYDLADQAPAAEETVVTTQEERYKGMQPTWLHCLLLLQTSNLKENVALDRASCSLKSIWKAFETVSYEMRMVR